MSKPNSRILASLVLTVALTGSVAVAAPAAIAAQGATTRVTISSTTDFTTGAETFVAQGGGLCPSGTAFVSNGVFTREHGQIAEFLLDKGFTCADGTGTFFLRLRAWYTPCEPTDSGVWTVIGGTGAYATLKGQGQLTGTYRPGPCASAAGLTDVYTGRMGP